MLVWVCACIYTSIHLGTAGESMKQGLLKTNGMKHHIKTEYLLCISCPWTCTYCHDIVISTLVTWQWSFFYTNTYTPYTAVLQHPLQNLVSNTLKKCYFKTIHLIIFNSLPSSFSRTLSFWKTTLILKGKAVTCLIYLFEY